MGNPVGDMLRKNYSSSFVYGYQPVYFNTGTIYDLEGGRLSLGKNDRYLVGGGFGNFMTGVIGSGNMFKSTLVLSFLLKTLEIYPESNLIIVDTEGSIIADLSRLIRFTDKKDKELLSRIHPIDAKLYSLAELFRLLTDILEERSKIPSKEIDIETPFINLETKQPVKTKIPLFIFIDSISELIVSEAQDLVNKGFDAKEFNTVHVVSGNKKNTFLQQLNILTAKHQVGVILSGQTGNTINMEHTPQRKQLPAMRQNERTKGAAAKFEYLPHIAYQMWSTSIFSNSAGKESQYPYDDFTPLTDLHKTSIKFIRQKINMSGNPVTNFIISQRNGLCNGLTNLEYLKDAQYFGLSSQNPRETHNSSSLIPDKKFTRRTIRKMLDEDYEIHRAMEICTHLHYVQNNWKELIYKKYPEEINIDKLYDKFINKGSSIKIQDILNSRGYWTYDKENKRKEMNIFDIMDLLKK